MCSRGSNAPLAVWLLGVEIASAEIEGVSGTRVVLQRGFLAPWKVRKWNAGENLILVTRVCGIVAEPINLSSVLFNEGHAGVLTEPLREPIPFENARPKGHRAYTDRNRGHRENAGLKMGGVGRITIRLVEGSLLGHGHRQSPVPVVVSTLWREETSLFGCGYTQRAGRSSVDRCIASHWLGFE